MKEIRTLDRIITAYDELVTPKLRIQRALPAPLKKRIDPFLLLDHIGPKFLKPGETIEVSPHPQRGFEPITILFEGTLEHKDSAGNLTSIKSGDVQWITAGSGIIHTEKLYADPISSGAEIHGIQLWINLPARKKMSAPSIQNIKASSIPIIKEDDGNITIKVIAGELYQQKGPAKTSTPLCIYHITINAGSKAEIPVDPEFNAGYYVISGEVLADNREEVFVHEMVSLQNNGNMVEIAAMTDVELLFLGGKPINEPIATYGTFVMNKFPELQQAIFDYEAGKMGTLTA